MEVFFPTGPPTGAPQPPHPTVPAVSTLASAEKSSTRKGYLYPSQRPVTIHFLLVQLHWPTKYDLLSADIVKIAIIFHLAEMKVRRSDRRKEGRNGSGKEKTIKVPSLGMAVMKIA